MGVFGRELSNPGVQDFSATIKPDTLPPGTVLYRIVDPGSFDNSTSWMGKAEFDQLTSKSEWRDKFAVWKNRNGNGEYVTYTVPPGPGLPVWRGTTASQPLMKDGTVVKANENGEGFWLQCGGEQIVVNPKDMAPRTPASAWLRAGATAKAISRSVWSVCRP